MSLNEGDILTVGSNGSAVLAFANGSAEDDRMTVTAGSTLSFSKLSNRKGTITKVSMFNGSAWVEVKSITNKDDAFSLETPTAIMGVRGTHLLVTVDPISGATHLTVAAGIVNTRTTDADNPDEKDVYPTQSALVVNDGKDLSQVTIASVDVTRLLKQSDGRIAQAIMEAAGEIQIENDRKMNQYLVQLAPQDNQSEKTRVKTNVENILGAITDQALSEGLISQSRINEILNAVREQAGVEIDLTKKSIMLTEEEKRVKEEQRKKDEEARKRAEERLEQERGSANNGLPSNSGKSVRSERKPNAKNCWRKTNGQ
ncbi:FecR domain-containing protein [Cohnella soli]|uniref:FecR domain-containing protein n=1 Tax=Cohnella soli TaxID=425005 RepID=A0ABW0HXH8_9BACL